MLNRRLVVRVVVGWSVLTALLFAVGWTLSEGEPVCGGPLILEASDSFPPECPGPAAALPFVVGCYFLGLILIVAGGGMLSMLRGVGMGSPQPSAE